MKRGQRRQLEREIAKVARFLANVAKMGEFDGQQTPENMLYMQQCTYQHALTGTALIFTRDTGHHSSGWFKNPDYERCLHLSMSPIQQRIVGQAADLTPELQRRWLTAFFGDNARLAWRESPKSDVGIQRMVTHWRVFCDERWQPIKPRGEVYSLDFTEKGWRSASELYETEGRVIESSLNPG